MIFIFANSRIFSLIHDAHNENKMQSLFSKKKFQIDDFFWFAYFNEWFDDFLLNIRVFLRTIEFCLIVRVFIRTIDDFFNSRIFTSNWRFCFVYSRISTSNLFQNKTFDRVSINFAKFKTKNLLCKKQWIIVIAN